MRLVLPLATLALALDLAWALILALALQLVLALELVLELPRAGTGVGDRGSGCFLSLQRRRDRRVLL